MNLVVHATNHLAPESHGGLVLRYVKPGQRGNQMFSGRVTRRGYLLFFCVEVIVIGVAYIFFWNNDPQFQAQYGWSRSVIIAALALLPPSLIYKAKRFHDFGWSAWSILLGFIPIVNLVVELMLLIVPGNKGPNKYGLDPRKSGTQKNLKRPPCDEGSSHSDRFCIFVGMWPSECSRN